MFFAHLVTKCHPDHPTLFSLLSFGSPAFKNLDGVFSSGVLDLFPRIVEKHVGNSSIQVFH